MTALATSNFSYYPLIWMFQSRNMEHSVKRIHGLILTLKLFHNVTPVIEKYLKIVFTFIN